MSITIMIFFITININNDDHHNYDLFHHHQQINNADHQTPGIQSSKAITAEEGVAKTEARDRQGVQKDLGNVQKKFQQFQQKE